MPVGQEEAGKSEPKRVQRDQKAHQEREKILLGGCSQREVYERVDHGHIDEFKGDELLVTASRIKAGKAPRLDFSPPDDNTSRFPQNTATRAVSPEECQRN
ncbi:hypothetical protein JTB14_004295 [Gonioctena quinquepunctata]|nr:hypothetical protein JTB14_004295 [Gonioctena quinquepunctata]